MSDQEQLTPQQEREYVEAAWVHVRTVFPCASGRYLIQIDPDSRLDNAQFEEWLNTEAAAWHAAFLFTKEHERKIAAVREEIEYVDSFSRMPKRNGTYAEHPVWKRILAREQAALADLLRSWREKGDGNGRG